jgi:hypothetical protein
VLPAARDDAVAVPKSVAAADASWLGASQELQSVEECACQKMCQALTLMESGRVLYVPALPGCLLWVGVLTQKSLQQLLAKE